MRQFNNYFKIRNGFTGLLLVASGLVGLVVNAEGTIGSGEQARTFTCEGLFFDEFQPLKTSRVRVEGESSAESSFIEEVLFVRIVTNEAQLGGDYADDLAFEYDRSHRSITAEGERFESRFFRSSIEGTQHGFTGFYLRFPLAPKTAEFETDLDYYDDGDHALSAALNCEFF